jgi:hypothetical protein
MVTGWVCLANRFYARIFMRVELSIEKKRVELENG